MRITRFLLCLALLLSVGSAATGCRTAAGFGEDVEAGGKAIERSARRHTD